MQHIRDPLPAVQYGNTQASLRSRLQSVTAGNALSTVDRHLGLMNASTNEPTKRPASQVVSQTWIGYPNHLDFMALREWCINRAVFQRPAGTQPGFVYTTLDGQDKWEFDEKTVGSRRTVRDKYPNGVMDWRLHDGLRHYVFYYPERMLFEARAKPVENLVLALHPQRPVSIPDVLDTIQITQKAPFGGFLTQSIPAPTQPAIAPQNWNRSKISAQADILIRPFPRMPLERDLMLGAPEPVMPQCVTSNPILQRFHRSTKSARSLSMSRINETMDETRPENETVVGVSSDADTECSMLPDSSNITVIKNQAQLTNRNLHQHTHPTTQSLQASRITGSKTPLLALTGQPVSPLRSHRPPVTSYLDEDGNIMLLAAASIDQKQQKRGIRIQEFRQDSIKPPRGRFFTGGPRLQGFVHGEKLQRSRPHADGW